MHLNLKPLIGQSIVTLEKRDYTWCFGFSGGDSLATEQAWRLVMHDGLMVTSEDHAQQYGMPKPVDAAEILKNDVSSLPITDASHDVKTGDLFLRFSDQKYVQFLQLSCGYESWRLMVGKREFICLGGGEYASFESP
jgi:hypothetical protein